MDSVNSNRLKPLGSLQLMAVIMVVIVHFGRSDCFFMGVHWMTFCFIYSGFFTAMHHRFGPGYSLRDHGRFMWKKVAKLYPLHLLGIVWGIVVAWLGCPHRQPQSIAGPADAHKPLDSRPPVLLCH